jgi:hypothetical protein
MTFEIVDSSPQALQDPNEGPKLDFGALQVGKSFKVPFGTMPESSLRSMASRASKKLGRKFRVLIHAESQAYEVARVS